MKQKNPSCGLSAHERPKANQSTAPVSNMLNKLHGQPESYDKKYVTNKL